jgi:L-asparaginase II
MCRASMNGARDFWMNDVNTNPVLVEVTRDGAVESRHRGAVCVYDAEGERVMAWGDVDTPVFPRSAIKPLQAMPFVETGAADAWKATAEELALACGSHSGEPMHVRVAQAWLERLRLSINDLACGPHMPLGEVAAQSLIAAGRAPTRLHNNCSGKHLAMLATALFKQEPIDGYTDPGHPAQQRIRAVLSEMSECDLTAATTAVDGCSAPTIAIPLSGIARAYAKFADTRWLPVPRQSAIRRLRVAIAIHREMVAGTDRFCTALMGRKGQALVIKGGAEGMFAAALPQLGLGVALKIDDGAKRASEVAVAALLRYLELFDDKDWTALEPWVAPTLFNHAGIPVGAIRAADRWLGH